MTVERTEVLVVGAGQAGVAASGHLLDRGIPHIVLERARIAERWRSERWDSLVANGPAWHDRYPGLEFSGFGPEDFVPKDNIADAFAALVAKRKMPVREGVAVTKVERRSGRPRFRAETSHGAIEANYIVAATGPFQKPIVPPLVPETAGLLQIHSAAYRNPAQLPAGAVVVVGAGSSGVQIADELQRAGRKVFLAVGPHDRPPRAYRGRDFVWWLGVLGHWDLATPAEGREHVTIAVSGAYGGRTIDFRKLAAQGITLTGRAAGFKDGKMTFAADLADNVRQGDANYLAVLDEADAYVARNGLDLPQEPGARDIGPDPDCMRNPILELDLAKAGVTSIIWATGFGLDYGWLKADTFDARGKPLHRRGVSNESGIYFLGLPWLSRRGSSFIWGVWHDAKFVADQIAIQQGYMAYAPPRQT